MPDHAVVTNTTEHQRPAPAIYVVATLVAAVVAASAALSAQALELAVWAMFVGWVAFFTRPTSTAQGLATGLCVWLGIGLGACATLAIGMLTPAIGVLSIAVVVFLVACLVVGLRSVPPLDNMLGWFLGLITFFAAHLPPSVATVVELGGTVSIGLLAGWIVQQIQARARSAR